MADPRPAPFVGRTAEMSVLSDVLQASESGVATVVVVGEPGSGKSRLLVEACSRVDGDRVLWIKGYETEQRIPLAAAAGMLRRLAGSAGNNGDLLAKIIAENAQSDPATERLRVFDAAHRCLASLGSASIIVDDLQWVDDVSLALCRYLAQAAAASGGRLALVAAGRPSLGVRELARVLKEEPGCTELELRPLSQADALELSRHLAPDLPRERAIELWSAAAGSPFYLELVLTADAMSVEIPELLSTRLAGGAPDASELVALLAIAARPLTSAEVADTLGWGPDRVEAARAELLNRGLVTLWGNTIALVHDLIRESAIRSLPMTARRELHLRFADHLESIAAGDVKLLSAALRHRRSSGQPSLAVALAIVRSPQRRMLGRDDLDELAAIADSEDGGDDESLELHRRIPMLAMEIKELEIALFRWSLLIERLAERGDRGEAALAAARAAFGLGRVSQADALLEQARMLSEAGSLLSLEIDTQAALHLRWLHHDMSGGRVLAETALAAARALVERLGGIHRVELPVRLAYLRALQAAFDAAFQSEDERDILAIAHETAVAALGDTEEDVKANINAALLMRQLGRFHEAETTFRKAAVRAGARLLPVLEVESRFWLGYTLRDLGRYPEARREAEAALALGRRVGTPPRMSLSYVSSLVHQIDASVGDARNALGELGRDVAAEADPHYRVLVRSWWAIHDSRIRGTRARAAQTRTFAAGRMDAVSGGCDRCRREFTLRMAEVLARVGDSIASATLLEEWDAESQHAYGIAYFWRRRAEAALALANSETERAADLLTDLLGEAEQMGFLAEQLPLMVDLAAAVERTDPGRAADLLARAEELATGLGAVTEREIAARALRGLGVRTWRRGPVAQDRELPLSERELEVARLVGAVASNPDIADLLFLSRRTVERHVSNILAKLEINNRTQLAATLASRGLDVPGGAGDGGPHR